MMVLQENNVPNQELMAPLSQALNLAEDFLQSSRAEMVDDASFKELDFAGLVHQATDDAYEAASQKHIKLQRNIVDNVWVQGNFGLLQRALLNLILNAVKFSPENADINIQLILNNQQAIFSVTNIGAGIAKAEQEKLFKRFSRTASSSGLSEGAGLGLYFVYTVAQKHGGDVRVQSEEGKLTCFSFSLPAIL
jgi:signal transduction histidine kinase